MRTPAGGLAADARISLGSVGPIATMISHGASASGRSVFTGPTTLFSKLHTYATYGSKVVSVTAVVDAQGRTPGKTTTDSVYLRSWVFDPIIVKNATLIAE